MKIPVCNNLDISSTNNVKGYLELEPEYFKYLCKQIDHHQIEYGELPEIELCYGFLDKDEENKIPAQIKLVDLKLKAKSTGKFSWIKNEEGK